MVLDEPILSESERRSIDAGRWFAALSPSLRHDLLRHGRPRRLAPGEFLFTRGEPATSWCAVASGAVRVTASCIAERPVALCFLGPGLWIADFATVEGGERLYDAQAHGATTLLELEGATVRRVLQQHQELYEALLRLHARRTRQMYALIEDLQSLPVLVRLAKQLVYLARQFGSVPEHAPGEIRIRLRLAQDDLAQLVAASRQRLNHELSGLASQGIVRVEPRQVVICDARALARLAGLTLTVPRAPLPASAGAIPSRSVPVRPVRPAAFLPAHSEETPCIAAS